MSKMAQVVEGEASESDSEIEEGRSPDSSACSKAFVISGEAPESDDESKIQSPSLDELDAPLHTSMFPASPTKLMHNSILHQKLWECNVSLRATIEGLVRNSTSICVEKLMTSDRILLSVQESMRATNANLTLARARLKQIHEELEKANCGSALPTVKIK
ncbi:uncharacterized protein LOC116776784 [Danaus plexippus]|uniref:uncharacterized protein LOC116776784 n=1 Tax=Danaus plexippus TaxID=13037 RepID=UPI002AB102B8|nr:uncharacterized protein LOC116776784 [Danaus plexippus]